MYSLSVALDKNALNVNINVKGDKNVSLFSVKSFIIVIYFIIYVY